MKRNSVLVLLPILLLAACGDDAAPTGEVDDGTAAEGEVLGGTISDEMLPLDRLQSQSPPLREETGSADGASSSESAESETAPPAEASEAVSENASEAEGESEPAAAED
ncbi:hypothetical protein SAMN06297468_0776 [Altererythrobacter xiamenensis]|uniref:Uncharacterized protein n=1 Tax=Altererythrobacter xiamenensis TaxID=1316679 RepID=A0A1Y6EK14_9SPHN|nr:hypothetical protein [Altererythrobacter xiamenensis]SMQ62947.1 hypothetical protein SAMN06297468_0776 [Altererythrobacter xiamenensis]